MLKNALQMRSETQPDQSSINERLEYLNCDLSRALRPSSRARLWLLSSIERNLRAYGLVDMDAWDILIEAYIRANRCVGQGGRIWNIVSWLKSASVLIIHENRHKQNKLEVLFLPDLQDIYEDIPTEERVYALHLAISLEFALNKLEQADRDLLVWKVGNGLSWADIQELLKKPGQATPTRTALRKRKQRAIQRLQTEAWKAGIRAPKLSEREFTLTSRYFSRFSLEDSINQ